MEMWACYFRSLNNYPFLILTVKILKDEEKKHQINNTDDNNPFGKTEIFICWGSWPETIHGWVFTELQLQSKVCAFLITDVPNNLPMHLSLMSISHRWESDMLFSCT